jgi:hypothetical protein
VAVRLAVCYAGGVDSASIGQKLLSDLLSVLSSLYVLFPVRESAPSTTRTCDLLVRSQTLYPTELWARKL